MTQLSLAIAYGILGSAAAHSQTATPVSDSSLNGFGAVIFTPSDSTRSPWLTKRQAAVGGVALLATIAVAPFDPAIAKAFRSPSLQRNDDAEDATESFAFMGGPGPFIVATGSVFIGAAVHDSTLAHAGVRATEGVLLAAGLTGLLKGLTGRALPGVSTPYSFSFGRGFHDNNGSFVSFPSGHTAAAFALAAVLSGEANRASATLGEVVTPVAYIGATGVGIARIYQHVHWASDLPIAAAIGTWSGMTVESRRCSITGSAVDRVIRGLSFVPTPAAGAMAVTWSSVQARIGLP